MAPDLAVDHDAILSTASAPSDPIQMHPQNRDPGRVQEVQDALADLNPGRRELRFQGNPELQSDVPLTDMASDDEHEKLLWMYGGR
ncbi:MAG: hypothetical protein CL927_15305 [Deltaproteobacteria bacterium]|nr:hypothetical protein [Deltaproteobacteria bacterium]HCH64521.1 hypothetical protein [Deltaproteobacteria bacterium]